MTPRSGPRQRHLASSPFAPRPEPVIEQFDVGDRVSHDSHGMGRVVNVESGAVTVDFGDEKVRIVSPYSKLEKF
jgi:hypothetical protein